VAEELSFNPFMRVTERSIQDAVRTTDPVEAMAALRQLKNDFK
jgi:hydroxyacylglutathione hydrolase